MICRRGFHGFFEGGAPSFPDPKTPRISAILLALRGVTV